MLEQALTVAAAKAKIFGLVVAAAAIGGTAATAGSFTPVAGEETVTTEATPAPTAAAEPTESPATEVAPVVETTAVTPAPCPTDIKNHGAYVSSVAKDKTLKGAEHGAAVSAAAHSDCGKKAADATAEAGTDDADEDETEDADEDDADDATEVKPSPKAKKANKGHGRG